MIEGAQEQVTYAVGHLMACYLGDLQQSDQPTHQLLVILGGDDVALWTAHAYIDRAGTRTLGANGVNIGETCYVALDGCFTVIA